MKGIENREDEEREKREESKGKGREKGRGRNGEERWKDEMRKAEKLNVEMRRKIKKREKREWWRQGSGNEMIGREEK